MTDKEEGFVISVNQRLCYGCGKCQSACRYGLIDIKVAG